MDALVSTGQGPLGNNMFAYCENNPINYSDPSGYCICSAVGSKSDFAFASVCPCGGCGAGGAGVLITLEIISATADVIEETAEKVIAWVIAQTGEEEYDDNSVYVLIDPTNKLVKYVGRTNDPVRRAYEHKHDSLHSWRRNYSMKVLVTGLSKEEAIIWEQTIISAFTLAYLENARREIAVKNTAKYYNYIDAVTEILTDIPADTIRDLINGR